MSFKISSVVITFNEEETIRACLGALQQVSDEIIVVDSFSSDKTPEIAQSFEKVRFVQRKWSGFSDQKNYGISLAANPYILSVDGDEVLSNTLIASISKAKFESDSKAFSFNILTYFKGQPVRHCGWYPGTKIRLWDSRVAHWEGGVHETLKFKEKVKVCHLKGDIDHFSIASFDVFLQKMQVYSNIFVEERASKGKKITTLRIAFGSIFTFIRMYFFRLGILDGAVGFQVATSMAFLNFLKYSKLKDCTTNS